MTFENLSWLLIGMGIGIMLGREIDFIFFFGMFLLLAGFIMHYVDDRSKKILKERKR